MERRKFIQTTASAIAALNAIGIYNSFGESNSTNRITDFFIGTPVLPEYLFEHGIAKTLDEMKELAGINTVMTFSHDHVFNQYRKDFRPKTDSEGHEYTNIWVKTNPKYYKNPEFTKQEPSAKYAGRDVLEELREEAQPRNMKVYARILEPYIITGSIPGFEEFAEVDANGNKGANVCFNHPEYIGYWKSVIDDLIYTHPWLHGFKFGQERGGPILSSMGKNAPGTCFCKHCLKIAKKLDIKVDKARKGLIAIQEFGNKINAGEKPVDGNLVTFLRILTQFPEVLSWEQFWMDSRENQRKRMYSQIKAIDENIQVGWHIDHGMGWDLLTRATWDYSKMGDYSDWLSVAVYFDSMGRRSMGHFDRNYKNILFGDAQEKYSYPMYLSMLGYNPETEPALEQHRQHDTSFSSEYVFEECQRAVTAVNGNAKVHARPGFDMPGYDCNVMPNQVYDAVTRALDAGVNGLWCGREWDELKPENARAFGDAVRDYQWKQG
jgi:hypothetical protein